jgi:hypothetical protein
MILKGMKMPGIEEYRIETPGSEEMFGYKDFSAVLMSVSSAV